jgi:hypothetical protein
MEEIKGTAEIGVEMEESKVESRKSGVAALCRDKSKVEE